MTNTTLIPSVWPGVLPKMLTLESVSVKITGQTVLEMFQDIVMDIVGIDKFYTPWMKLDIWASAQAGKLFKINIPLFFTSVVFAGVRFDIPDPYVLDASLRGKEFQHMGDIRLSEAILDIATGLLIIFLLGKLPLKTMARILKKLLLIRRKDQLTRIEKKLEKYHKEQMDALNKMNRGINNLSNDINKMSTNIRGDISELRDDVLDTVHTGFSSVDDKLDTLSNQVTDDIQTMQGDISDLLKAQNQQQKMNMSTIMRSMKARAKSIVSRVHGSNTQQKDNAVHDISKVVDLDDAEMSAIGKILSRYRFI